MIKYFSTFDGNVLDGMLIDMTENPVLESVGVMSLSIHFLALNRWDKILALKKVVKLRMISLFFSLNTIMCYYHVTRSKAVWLLIH